MYSTQWLYVLYHGCMVNLHIASDFVIARHDQFTEISHVLMYLVLNHVPLYKNIHEKIEVFSML